MRVTVVGVASRELPVNSPSTVGFATRRRREQAGMTNSPDPSAAKPVDDWVTGDEPMTGPQRSYLHTLAREAGEEAPDDLTKAQASEMIDRLQQSTGRGADEPVADQHTTDQQAMVLGDLDQAD